MIQVDDIVADADFAAPEPFQILRSTPASEFVLGGFESVITTIDVVGPVQQSSNREINMLPEADRVGSIRSFWCLQPIYLTRGYAPVPSTLGQEPQGAVPGTVYVLTTAPAGGAGTLTLNGVLQRPIIDYTLNGLTITFNAPTPANSKLYFASVITANVQPEASDIIVWPPNGPEQWRVMQRYFDPGAGYWKAIANRMNAA